MTCAIIKDNEGLKALKPSWASKTVFKLPFTSLAHHSTTDNKFCFSNYSHIHKTLIIFSKKGSQ